MAIACLTVVWACLAATTSIISSRSAVAEPSCDIVISVRGALGAVDKEEDYLAGLAAIKATIAGIGGHRSNRSE